MTMRPFAWLLLPILVGGTALRHPETRVTGVALSNEGGMARLSIAVSGHVTVKTSELHNPERVVLDISSAHLDDVAPYDGKRRGNISAVRMSQRNDTTVRVIE